MEEQTDFPIVMRGYDRVQVDLQIQTLNNQISELQQRLDTVDQRNVDLGEQLAEAQKQLRSSDRSSYTGIGARIEQLLRSAEEQSTAVINKANAEAEQLMEKTRKNAQDMSERAEAEAASLISEARREAEERTTLSLIHI